MWERVIGAMNHDKSAAALNESLERRFQIVAPLR
jgi:hypothetical protein